MECGCTAKQESSDGKNYWEDDIDWCPLHKAAPELLEALEFIRLRFMALQMKCTTKGVTKKQLQNDAYVGQLECEIAISPAKATGA